jgi:Fe-S-cluster containining protein
MDFEDDLFECQRCGQCCRGYGGTYVTPADVRAISAYVGCAAEEFVARYGRVSCGRPLLAQGPDGYCIFWEGLCSIHPVKPLMCRRWPFIPAVLRDVGNWHAMATACPGMRTDVSDAKIQRVVAWVLAREPDPQAAGGTALSSGANLLAAGGDGRRRPPPA